MNNPIKLLIVDDSPLMRKVLHQIFDTAQNIQIVGDAQNGLEALELIKTQAPHVIIMDINMPKMDGLTALKHVMIKCPTPTVMFSTLTKDGTATAFNALKFGAVDFAHKPSNMNASGVELQAATIIKKIELAAQVEIGMMRYTRSKTIGSAEKPEDTIACDHICAIGAAEGGYGTLIKIIPNLRPDLSVGFIIVLHEENSHVDNFTRYLKSKSAINISRVKPGETVMAGCCYMAATDELVTIEKQGKEFKMVVKTVPQSDQRSGIDKLMMSLSAVLGSASVGIVLSGTGSDGVEGLQEISRAGGGVIVQDPKTSLQKEMVETAIERCQVDIVLPDNQIATEINTSFFL